MDIIIICKKQQDNAIIGYHIGNGAYELILVLVQSPHGATQHRFIRQEWLNTASSRSYSYRPTFYFFHHRLNYSQLSLHSLSPRSLTTLSPRSHHSLTALTQQTNVVQLAELA